jgi:glycosyltransferase involved in cell wall biosynthesis
MKNDKPVIVAAGFIRQRHETLFRELQSRFEVRLFASAGNWPGVRPFHVEERDIDQREVEDAAKSFWQFLTQIESEFKLPDRGKEIWHVIQSLLVVWIRCRHIREALIRFHQRRPVAAVVVVNDHLAPHRTLVVTAKSLGIPTIYIDHALPFVGFMASSLKSKNGVAIPVSDVVCVDSELHQEMLLGYYDGPNAAPAMYVTGAPLDSVKVVSTPSPSETKLGSRNIIFCPSWYEPNFIGEAMFGNLFEHRAFELFCRMIQGLSAAADPPAGALHGQQRLLGNSFNLVVKLHPTLTKQIGTDTASYYLAAAERHGLKIVVDDGPIAKWLSDAELLVTSRNSSVAWEAFLHHVPVITYLCDFYKRRAKAEAWQQPSLLASWGVQHYFSDETDWAEGALELLTNKRSGEFAQLCEQHRSKLKITPVETAAVNVANVIVQVARPTPSRAKPPHSSKLKILEVVHNFPPHSFSGTELYTLNLSKELQKRGHDVTVLYPIVNKTTPPYSCNASMYGDVKVMQFNVHDPAGNARSDYFNPAYDQPFRNFLAANDFDAVHFQHVYGLSANWIAIAKELGIAVFLKVDDMFFYCMKTHLINRAGAACSGPDSLDKCHDCVFNNADADPNAIAEGYQRLAFRRAFLQRIFNLPDFVQAASQYVKEGSVLAGFNNANFKAITTGIAPFDTLPRERSNSGQLTLGFLGYVHVRKGILDFLNAIEIFQKSRPTSNLKFVIHGHHLNDDLYKYMLAKVSRLQNVSYHGSFEPKNRAQILSQLDLLVMPSIGENYPFLLREALYAGVPVAASKIAGVPEIVKPGENGFLFPPGDAQALAAIFAELANDPAVLQRLKPRADKIKLIADEAQELEAEFYRVIDNRVSATAAIALRQAAEQNRIDLLFDQGRELVRQNNVVDGMAMLARLLDLKPNHPPTLHLMGEIYYRLGKQDEARQMWQLAMAASA